MGVDQRLAPIELLPDRCEGSVAEIFVLVARHQADAVGLERVERVFDFLETALRVEQRNGRETGKAARVVPCELRTELVAEARDSTSLLDVRDRRARLDQRKYRCGDAALVHVFDRHGGRPLERGARTAPADFLEIAGVREVVVNVYTVWLAACRDGCPLRLLRHQPAGKRAGSTQRGKLAQETAPRGAAGASQGRGRGVFGEFVEVGDVVILRSDGHGPPPVVSTQSPMNIPRGATAEQTKYPITLTTRNAGGT